VNDGAFVAVLADKPFLFLQPQVKPVYHVGGLFETTEASAYAARNKV
jgi:hypothetical protein